MRHGPSTPARRTAPPEDTGSPITAKADSAESTAQSGSEMTDSSLIGITLNRLAREQMKLRLLADIRTDLVVCELEGISQVEYLDELIELLEGMRHKRQHSTPQPITK